MRWVAYDDELPPGLQEQNKIFNKAARAIHHASQLGMTWYDLRIRRLVEERVGNESVKLDKPVDVLCLIACEEKPGGFISISYGRFPEV